MADFLVFNQEMIALLKAGLPVVHSFEILLERQQSAALRRVLADVREQVNSGASLSEAFAEQGDLFPRLFWTSLKAGREDRARSRRVLRRYPEVPEDGHRLVPQGRLDARLSGHPDPALGRPDRDPDDVRDPAVLGVLRRLPRRAAAADADRHRHGRLPAQTTSSRSSWAASSSALLSRIPLDPDGARRGGAGRRRC